MKRQAHVTNGVDETDADSQSGDSDIVVKQLKPGKHHRRNRSMERVPVIADIENTVSEEELYQSKGMKNMSSIVQVCETWLLFDQGHKFKTF